MLKALANGVTKTSADRMERNLDFHFIKYQEPASISDSRAPLELLNDLALNIFQFVAASNPTDVLLIDSFAALATEASEGNLAELGINSGFYLMLIAIHNFALYHNRVIIATFHPPSGKEERIQDLISLLEAKVGGVFQILGVKHENQLSDIEFSVSLRDGSFDEHNLRNLTMKRAETVHHLFLPIGMTEEVDNNSKILSNSDASSALARELAMNMNTAASIAGAADSASAYQTSSRKR